MKFLAVFAAIFAVACANNVWTVQQLSSAIASPHTDPTLKPYLEAALNQMMSDLWAGHQVEAVSISIPAEGNAMTLEQLSAALQNPETDPALIPSLEAALNQIMDDLFAGIPVGPAVVGTPALEIHYYTLHELSEIIQNPNTNEALVPHLEQALNQMMETLFAGEQMETIVIAIPVSAIPVVPEVVPSPVDVPIAPVVPAVPVTPEAPASPTTLNSPLVQIIVNINQQSAESATTVVDPVHVVESTPVGPAGIAADQPANVIDVMPVVTPANILPAIVKPVPVRPVLGM